jgi:hypothetical protein
MQTNRVLLICLVFVLLATLSGHFGYNAPGTYHSCISYSSCPNCGGRWSERDYGTLLYKKNVGVTICQQCLDDPANLNAQRIGKVLIEKHMWDIHEVTLVREAIMKYKVRKGMIEI